MRYQTVIASSRETNFARQFSSVSLVHKMETNIERQFFEVCPFIFAVQQNLPDPLTNVSRVKLLSIRRRWQIKIPSVGRRTHREECGTTSRPNTYATKSVLLYVIQNHQLESATISTSCG